MFGPTPMATSAELTTLASRVEVVETSTTNNASSLITQQGDISILQAEDPLHLTTGSTIVKFINEGDTYVLGMEDVYKLLRLQSNPDNSNYSIQIPANDTFEINTEFFLFTESGDNIKISKSGIVNIRSRSNDEPIIRGYPYSMNILKKVAANEYILITDRPHNGVNSGGVRLSAAGTFALSSTGIVTYEAEETGTLTVHGNATVEGIIFPDASTLTTASHLSQNNVRQETSNAYTLTLSDAFTFIRCNGTGNTTITIPAATNVDFPTGTEIVIFNESPYTIQFLKGGGAVELRSIGTTEPILKKQYEWVRLKKYKNNDWALLGDLGVFHDDIVHTPGVQYQFQQDVEVLGDIVGGGALTTTGNIVGANLGTSGILNVLGAASTGTLTSAGNVSGVNIIASGDVSAVNLAGSGNLSIAGVTATGNITGANLSTGGTLTVTGVANTGALTSTGNLSGVNVIASGDVSGVNLTGTGNLSIVGATATGTVTAANLSTGGTLTVTGATNTGTLTSTGNISGVDLIGSGNISGVNLTGTGNLSIVGVTATGTVTGANLSTGGTLTVTGASNTGALTSTGDLSGVNLVASGNVNIGGYIEFADSSQLSSAKALQNTVRSQGGVSYTLALTDAWNYIRINPSGAFTLTVPNESSVNFDIGTQIDFFAAGTGTYTFAAAAGVTIYSKGGALQMDGQYSASTLKKVSTNGWDLIGALV